MNNSIIERIRRNHALEHATISILSRRYPKNPIFGISGPLGFTLLTKLSIEEVYPAAAEALRQLKQGHQELAIHPNCGTNLLTAAAMTTGATFLSMGGFNGKPNKRFERIIQTIIVNAFLLLIAQPIGRWIQSHITVDSSVGDLEIAAMVTECRGTFRRIRIHTTG